MFKLITEEKQKLIRKEYLLRRTIIMVAAFAAVLIVGIVGLFPSYILSNSRYSEVLSRTEILKTSQTQSERNELLEWLKSTTNKLVFLSPSLDTDRPVEIFKNFLNEDRLGIKITSLSWKKNGEKITVIISGVASDRQKLLNFEQEINSSGEFSKFSLPVSQYAKEKDIDFQITVSPIANKEQ